MDKTIILAVAGSGKTTYIVDNLSTDKRSLIITYTNGNYDNLSKRIRNKFDGKWPPNIVLMKYFHFLYYFCYKPLFSDKIKAKGVFFETNPVLTISQNKRSYYLTDSGYFYSNRLAFFLERCNAIENINKRIEKYFDELVIDEVQDIASRDFNFLLAIMNANINMLFVGDFYQHTYDTSRDGNVNKSLFDDINKYKQYFIDAGFVCDENTLVKSWRCSYEICKFINDQLGIKIVSQHEPNPNSAINLITTPEKINEILNDNKIIKLHYREASNFGIHHRNWGETKGEDQYNNVCILLNKTTMGKWGKNDLISLAPSTKNKLYVAITRARQQVYFIDEKMLK